MTTDHIPGRNGGKLRRIPKGTSGNPNGRPKKLPEIDKLLADVLGEEKDGVTAADAILRKLRAMAAQGNIRAAEILLDRAYGKAKQTMDLTAIIPPVQINVKPEQSGRPEQEAE